jgi:hypothetical protein
MCHMSNVIVWDLETVPDIQGFAAANGHDGKSDDEVRAELGDKFPKHIYHSIICIGALVAHREEGGRWTVDALGAPHIGERSEKELIASFVDRIAALSPQLVTFNGSSFDLPVLRYRAMVHGVAAPGLGLERTFRRLRCGLCFGWPASTPISDLSIWSSLPSRGCLRTYIVHYMFTIAPPPVPATETFCRPRGICSICSNRKTLYRSGSAGRRSCCGPKVFTALALQRAATKPPSSEPFARPCAPPSGVGSPPIANREGQLIGQEILEHYDYRGQVMRVLFTAQDSQTIRDTFGRAKPNAEYARLYTAAVARRQADQIYNLSLTRTATVILGQGARRVIGVGRVKTPTLAIVCKRELEIRNFVPIAYFEVVATAKVAGGQFQMRHAPQERILKRETAETVVNAAQGFEGPA